MVRKNDIKKFALSSYLILAISITLLVIFGTYIIYEKQKLDTRLNDVETEKLVKDLKTEVGIYPNAIICDENCFDSMMGINYLVNRPERKTCFDRTKLNPTVVKECCYNE
jgi:ASC-1-like (ASCH) protein